MMYSIILIPSSCCFLELTRAKQTLCNLHQLGLLHPSIPLQRASPASVVHQQLLRSTASCDVVKVPEKRLFLSSERYHCHSLVASRTPYVRKRPARFCQAVNHSKLFTGHGPVPWALVSARLCELLSEKTNHPSRMLAGMLILGAVLTQP